MGHISLEEIYPAEVAEFGHMRVGMTQRYVVEHMLIEGTTTVTEIHEWTCQLLRDEAVQLIVSGQLAALPADYDPWIWMIQRRRALREKYGDDVDNDDWWKD